MNVMWHIAVAGDMTTPILEHIDDQYDWQFEAGCPALICTTGSRSGLGLLSMARVEGNVRASSSSLTAVLDGIYELASRGQFGEINAILRAAEVSELAPEFLVGLPRVTYRWRSKLGAWSPFVEAAKNELHTRGNFDIATLFDGIEAIPA